MIRPRLASIATLALALVVALLAQVALADRPAFRQVVVEPETLVVLESPSPAVWVPQVPLTLDYRNFETVAGDDVAAQSRSWVVVFWAAGPPGSTIIVDAWANGPRVPVFTRHVVTIRGTPDPVPPTPDPNPPAPDPVPPSPYGVGPAVAQAARDFPASNLPALVAIFRSAAELALRQGAFRDQVLAELHRQAVELHQATGGALGAVYQTYKREILAAEAAGRVPTMAAWAGALEEIATWLEKPPTRSRQ